MKIKLRNTTGTLGCTLQTEKGFRFSPHVPCAYDAETAAYAACRLLRRSGELRDTLVAQAVRLGLSVGRGRKAVDRRIRVPARGMELPGNTAWIHVRVSQGTITVRSVELR